MECEKVVVFYILKCENLRFQRLLWMLRWSYSPMGSTCNMSTMTRLNLMHGQDDTVLVPCGGGQRATLQVTMHVAVAASAPSWLLYSKAVLESKTTPYVIMLWNLVSLHICRTRLNFHCKDNLSSGTLQFLNTWWPEYLLISCNVVSIPIHLCPALWVPCTILKVPVFEKKDNPTQLAYLSLQPQATHAESETDNKLLEYREKIMEI